VNRVRISFFLAGAVSGVTTALVGAKWPVVLAVGVGPTFFLALLAGMSFAGACKRATRSWQRWSIAAALSTAVYILSLFAFSLAAGYSPDLLGVARSSDIVDFRGDVWVGIMAALLVASAGVELATWVLVGSWNTRAFLFLASAGLVTVLLAYAATSIAHSYWSFIGVLLSLGQGSFCGLVGLQILKSK
jgi:hypothetical protein